MISTVTQKYNQLIADGAFSLTLWGKREDIASAVAVFTSNACTYTTGNVVDVDGGFHIRRFE